MPTTGAGLLGTVVPGHFGQVQGGLSSSPGEEGACGGERGLSVPGGM